MLLFIILQVLSVFILEACFELQKMCIIDKNLFKKLYHWKRIHLRTWKGVETYFIKMKNSFKDVRTSTSFILRRTKVFFLHSSQNCSTLE